MKKQLPLVLLCFFVSNSIKAQTCSVSVDALKGTYTGDCKKGKANGKGTATGTDNYTGDFKNGYPDGHGKYMWKNGNSYDGNWKNGMFDGFGILNQKNSSDSSTVITGNWKDGKFINKNEKPFVIHAATSNISNIAIRKINGSESDITITIRNTTAGASTIKEPVLPKTNLTSIETLSGTYREMFTDSSSRVVNKYVLHNVSFPFYAILTFATPNKITPNDQAKIEITEDGKWMIQVNVDN